MKLAGTTAALEAMTATTFLTLPRYELERDDEHPEGRHYLTPQGVWAASVTNWIERGMDPRGLQEWRERVGEERAERIRKVAAARGTQMHADVERYLTDGAEPEFDFLSTPYWNSIRPFLRNIRHTALMEGMVWHPEGYAGTLDWLGYHVDDEGNLSLNDWKSADKPCNEMKLYRYKMQAAAYVKGAEHVYQDLGLHIPRARVVVALPDQLCQVYLMERDEIDQLFIHFKAQKKYYNMYKR